MTTTAGFQHEVAFTITDKSSNLLAWRGNGM